MEDASRRVKIFRVIPDALIESAQILGLFLLVWRNA